MSERNDDIEKKLGHRPWPDTGRAMGLSRTSTYLAVKSGEIPTVRVGGRIIVPEWFHAQMRGPGRHD